MPVKGVAIPQVRGKKISNAQEIAQSVMDCRRAYSDLSDYIFSLWYERKYGIKSRRVLEILGAQS
jgi:hypothetical protein